MAEDRDDAQQTEEPSAKRLEQARQSGDSIKSSEFATFILLAGGTLAIAMFGKQTALGLGKLLAMFLEQPDVMGVDGGSLAALGRGLLFRVAQTLAPFFGMML